MLRGRRTCCLCGAVDPATAPTLNRTGSPPAWPDARNFGPSRRPGAGRPATLRVDGASDSLWSERLLQDELARPVWESFELTGHFVAEREVELRGLPAEGIEVE